ALVCEEDKMCIADAHTIAMLERSVLDRNIVDEGAVKTLQIGDFKSRFLLFDSGVTARHGSVSDTEPDSSIATNNESFIANREDCSLELPGHCCETRRH